MKYEVFIKSGWGGAEIQADSAEAAKETFLQTLRDNIRPEQIEANNLDTDDGLDPSRSLPTEEDAI